MVKSLLIFFLFGCAATGFASERPELIIQDGENEIFLTIKNLTYQPVRQLEIDVKQALPNWLRVPSQSFFLNDEKGSIGEYQVFYHSRKCACDGQGRNTLKFER